MNIHMNELHLSYENGVYDIHIHDYGMYPLEYKFQL
jgi:hypothetical protein